MRARVLLLMLGLGLAASGCNKPADHPTGQIAWREGDVDDAFNEAREAHKPVLLYWGAKWCPPCNLMKQTLFKDPGFIAETRNFIPVHLDGDSKDAQTWGQRFGIQGYPTVIILTPDHTEVTRLDGGSTASELTGVLEVAAKRTTSTEDLLSRAENPAALSASDWRLLASFDWLDDPKHFGDRQKGAAFVARLAAPLARRGEIVWVLRRDDLHAPGLASLGFPTERLIQVCARDDDEALGVLEDALRTPGVAAAFGEVGEVSLTAGRRLQLACEQGGATGFVLRRRPYGGEAKAEPGTAAATRWTIAPAPSEQAVGDLAVGLGAPRWRVTLERCRGGRTGAWILEAREEDDAPHPFRLVANLADRDLAAQTPLRRAS